VLRRQRDFHDSDPRASLPGTLVYAADLSYIGHAAQRPDVRLAAEMLACTLGDLAQILDEQWFLHVGGTTNDIIAPCRAPRAEHSAAASML
jgi:hypothetical protein